MAVDLTFLSLFTGTEHFYRLNRQCLITYGVKHLVDEEEAYWLLVVAADYLLELETSDWFALLRLDVIQNLAIVTLKDFNGVVRASQQIPFTHLTMTELDLYACWNGDQWVIMLTEESKTESQHADHSIEMSQPRSKVQQHVAFTCS
jgi:hypothetical protein